MMLRLNKYLADRGVASRRKCDEYIAQGMIKINGVVVTELGTKVDTEKDTVEVAPQLQLIKAELKYYVVNKPVGYVCSVTGPEEPKVTELVKDIPARLFPVGRLDKLTSGLLIMTNDGQFAYELTHPKFEKEKEYVVKVREKVTDEKLRLLRERFFIKGKLTQPPDIQLASPHLFHVILHEGRNRQIRRMCERTGLTIEKLKRIRIAKLVLGNIDAGQYKELNAEHRDALKGLTKEVILVS
ncbi:rRNA pseudouridine synthase [Candidatus Gracilibacteria bacterium]|nr:rRNA pseudouridine synthase [Candidatus Gracilibacteria bacterium]